jgi:hypothetical protein
MVFNTTFNNISVISWRSVLLVEAGPLKGSVSRDRAPGPMRLGGLEPNEGKKRGCTLTEQGKQNKACAFNYDSCTRKTLWVLSFHDLFLDFNYLETDFLKVNFISENVIVF